MEANKNEYYPQIEKPIEKNKSEYLEILRKNFSAQQLVENLDKLQGIKVLIIGDTILDEYCFTLIKGRAIKDPILSARFLDSELYAGGVLAIANHVSNYVDNVNLITLIGEKNDKLNFIKTSLNKNINLKYFVKPDSYTTIKKRYLNKHRGEKIFKIEFLDDHPVDLRLEEEIISYLKEELPKYDLVIVGDYGHGFISDKMIQVIEYYSKYLAVNAQSNSANLGFNYIDRYKAPHFASMDVREVQHVIRDRFSPYHELIKKFKEKLNFQKFLITLGKNGCVFSQNGQDFYAPTFKTSSVDTIGAGDAVFSIISLLEYSGIESELIPFYANCAGGVAVGIMGNKESVKKDVLINLIRDVYYNGEVLK